MRWLKVMVVAMGVMIIAMLTLLVVAGVRQADAPAAADITIELPPGAIVQETLTGEGRIVVRAGLPDGGTRLFLMDIETGARIGTVTLRPGPPERD